MDSLDWSFVGFGHFDLCCVFSRLFAVSVFSRLFAVSVFSRRSAIQGGALRPAESTGDLLVGGFSTGSAQLKKDFE